MSCRPHLVVQVADFPLPCIAPILCQRYTHWSNWSHDWVGPFFQGRYKAVLFDSRACLLELVRETRRSGRREGAEGGIRNRYSQGTG